MNIFNCLVILRVEVLVMKYFICFPSLMQDMEEN
jgi:hypothetical protein